MTRTPPLGTTRDPQTGSWCVVFIGERITKVPMDEPWTHRQAVLAMREEQGRTE